MNTLAERLAALSPEQRERISQRLKLRSGTPTAQIPTQSRTTNAFPLSFTQQRLWFLDQLEPGNPFYNIPSAFRLTGKLDIAVLKQSLSELAQRHEALRTTFTQEADGGQPMQVIAATTPIALTMVDLRAQPAADREEEATRRILTEGQQPFDLVQGPLWRTLVMQLDEQKYVVVFTMHHIIFDGWSLGVFVRELATIYTALMAHQPIPLPSPTLQYADYASWQRQWFPGEVKDTQLAYWKEHLGGDLPLLDLPADRPRPLAQTFQGAVHSVLLPWSLYLALKDLSRQHETTLFMTFLTAFKTLIYRYTDQEDIIVGFPISGRNRQETEGVIGPFVNTLALRAHLAENPHFLDLLGQVRTVTLGAYANQDVPFDLLVEVLQPERNLSYNPLFQVMFTYQNSLSTMELPDLTMHFLPVDCGTAKFDLSLDVYEGPNGPTCVFEYNTDLFDTDRIIRMATHFQTLLEGIVADPHQRIADLPLIPAAEQALLTTWNETTTNYELERGFIQSFEAQVQRTPTAVAATDEQKSLTYAELNQRANRIAHKLIAYGVGPDVIVPLLAERSTHFLTAILAVLKAGGAYLPLDPHHPPARIAQILDQSDARLILTTQEFLNVIPAALDQRTSSAEVWTVFIETLLHTSQQDENPPSRSTAQHLAYVLFTSGSTGTPKGVMIEHAGMLNHLLVMNEQLALDTDTTVAQTASQCFDISVWQFLSVLLVGGRVHIINDETVRDPVQLIGTVAGQNITILEVVPSLLNAMLDELTEGTVDYEALASLRWLIPTGETLTPELCRRWLRLYPAIPLLNAYGPAECADDVTLYPIVTPPASDTRFMPIGHPVANIQTYILDQHQHPVPVGVCGELYIGGVGVGRGYLNDIVRTTEAFLLDPFADQPGARLYKTGDLARYDADGNIVFLGRADYQVKVRGFRIELGEIEAQLCRHTAVHDAVVVAWEGAQGDKQLVGYVVADMAATSREGLTSYLKDRLPEYMVPSALMLLETLPRTATGKVDRRALPAPEYQQSIATGSFIGPRTRIEEMLAELWHQAFGIKQISIYDDFFSLGGHSLLAIQLMTQVRRVFQVDIPLKYLFQAPTIAGFANIIAECQGQQLAYRAGIDSIPVITPDTAGQYTPFPLTEVQQAYWIGRSEAFELGNVSTHNYDELEFENLNLARLTVAWQQLIERHGMLRAIVLPDGQQQILAHVPPYDIAVLDLRDKDAAEVDERITALRQEMSHQILSTDEWPVFDLRVTLLDDQRARLHLSTDSLTFDAWSFVVLMRELVQLHEQPEVPLPPVELSFRDYVLAERSLHHTPQYQRSYDYWQKIIPTLPPAPALPLVKNPSTIERPRFTRLHATLDAERWGRLKAKATRLGLTPTGILLAAYAEILTAWSKSPQFTLNLTFLNRLPIHPQVNDIVGEFTSLTLLAVDNGTPDTFAVRARRAQERLWDDLEHYHVSGIWVLRELKRRQGGVTSAKMPIVFTSALTLPIPDVHDAPLTLRPVHSITQTSQVYLDCGVWEDARTLLCNWDVVEELFPDGLLQEMFAAFWQLVERLADEDDIWQQTSVSLVPVAQIEQRTQANATDAPAPTAMLHELFATQVERCPQHAAVVTPTHTLTYAEVEQRANQLGRQLRENGAQPNQLVAVVMEKGWEQVVGTLSILKAGAAYLPIDPELPQERIWYLLEHGQVELVLTQSWIDTHVIWPTFVQRLCVDTAPCTAPDNQPLEAVQGSDDLAYVIFTSGSTGLPKGVMINHRGAVNTIVDCNQRFGLTSRERVLALSALNFDLSVYDIFGTLAAGGTIIMPRAADRRDPAHWFDLAQREQVTLWNSVPALMNLLIDYVEHTKQSLPASLRLVMLSGDWIPLSLPERIKARGQAVSVYSLGGATEASIWSILYPIETVDPAWQSIPYGRPMVNQRFYVLNHALEPCPIWVAGQLYIGGVGLALGYWRDPEKTNASFITHPHTGERLYRTGDLGRYLPDGTIEFLGREDSQVKIQGHRIELGEIETALLQHPIVQYAIVLVTGATSGSKRLAAYVVPHPGQCCEKGDLRRFLQGKLPEYMVPPTFTCLDALPLTPNGKVDRKALASAAHSEPTQNERSATPQTPVEQTLVQIWAELLEIESVGVTDNFFELGGDSILAVHAVTRMREAFDVSFPLRDFFIQPVIADLAASIDEQCAVCTD